MQPSKLFLFISVPCSAVCSKPFLLGRCKTFSNGRGLVFPSEKCLAQTQVRVRMASSDSLNSFIQADLHSGLFFLLGKRLKDNFSSFSQLFPHTQHLCPGISSRFSRTLWSIRMITFFHVLVLITNFTVESFK